MDSFSDATITIRSPHNDDAVFSSTGRNKESPTTRLKKGDYMREPSAAQAQAKRAKRQMQRLSEDAFQSHYNHKKMLENRNVFRTIKKYGTDSYQNPIQKQARREANRHRTLKPCLDENKHRDDSNSTSDRSANLNDY